VVDEFDGGRTSGLVLILEGRYGKGWDLFGSVLRLVNEHFRAGVRDGAVETEVQAVRGSRRSYAEVLVKTLPPLEECFGVSSRPVARVPRWVRELCRSFYGQVCPSSGDNQEEDPSSGKDFPYSGESSYDSSEDYPTSGEAFCIDLWS
jgi:hypothetical protein